VNRCEIQWKRFKHKLSVIDDVLLSPNSPLFNLVYSNCFLITDNYSSL